jgi:hypothetical protein
MSIRDNLLRVTEAIREAESRAARPEGSVSLMAISKFHPAAEIQEAINSGQFLFGENRVQEAVEKFGALMSDNPKVELHLVGTLQRNKAAKIVSLASCVQSVDRQDILVELDRRARAAGKVIEVLFEFHTGEESKSGFPDESSLFACVDSLADLDSVRCSGLMTMAPFTNDERAVRASFSRLRALRDDCAKRYPELDFTTLSMGMSNDYRIAIEEGSTLVRVGTAIFGARA